jgi:hypothetical protein
LRQQAADVGIAPAGWLAPVQRYSLRIAKALGLILFVAADTVLSNA